MTFETYIKQGRGWSYTGVVKADSPREAAKMTCQLYRKHTAKVRPEDSRDKFIVYKL